MKEFFFFIFIFQSTGKKAAVSEKKDELDSYKG